MLKGADFVEEWLEERETLARRDMLLRYLRSRFGPLSTDTESHVAELTSEQCKELFDRALEARDLAELGL